MLSWSGERELRRCVYADWAVLQREETGEGSCGTLLKGLVLHFNLGTLRSFGVGVASP